MRRLSIIVFGQYYPLFVVQLAYDVQKLTTEALSLRSEFRSNLGTQHSTFEGERMGIDSYRYELLHMKNNMLTIIGSVRFVPYKTEMA